MDRSTLREYAFRVEEMGESMGWDETPVMHVLRDNGKLEIFMLDVPTVSQVLSVMPPFDGAEAIIICTEGWSFPRPLLEEFDSVDSLLKFAKNNPPAEHPQRVEVRVVTGVTKEDTVMVRRCRGSEPEEVTTGEEEESIGGNITQELLRLVGR